MKRLTRSKGLISGALVLTVMLGVLAGALFFHGAEQTHAARAQFASHPMSVKPVYRQATTKTVNGKVLFTCQNNHTSSVCYGPDQMRQAYDIERVLQSGDQGQGTTIVIIDAYQSPTIAQDLATFNQTWGLPTSQLKIIAPDGLTPFNPNDPDQVAWAGEITLDVEWSHAIAPLANIDLVLARNYMDASLLSVTKYAVDRNLGAVISQSFGEAEKCMDPGLMHLEHLTFQEAAKKGITVFASSGDEGSAQPNCAGTNYILSASTPASDPFVTGVGGTYLNANAVSGRYTGEAAWNENDIVQGATGGGYSQIYSRPSYQNGFNQNAQRAVPDVAYNASVDSGVLAYWGSAATPGWYTFGGTSAGSPQWAAMLALVNTEFGRQGDINPILYEGFASHGYNTYFHDIKVGNNAFAGAPAIPGYDTRIGWDPVDGLGSFDLGNTFFGPQASSALHFWYNS